MATGEATQHMSDNATNLAFHATSSTSETVVNFPVPSKAPALLAQLHIHLAADRPP